MDARHFRLYVIRPTLQRFADHVPYSLVAETLLLGTAMVESHITYLKQLSGGPALGVYQIEPATHSDIWQNYLRFRPAMAEAVRGFSASQNGAHEELIGNLFYSSIIARLVYRRSPMPLPAHDDVAALSDYHKAIFNSQRGSADPNQSARAFYRVAIGDLRAEDVA